MSRANFSKHFSNLANTKYTTMIGIIIWAILILFIVICTCPGFITALFVSSAVVLCAYGLINALAWWVKNGLKFKRKGKGSKAQSYVDAIAEEEREKAICEWERKWGRKHPSRK